MSQTEFAPPPIYQPLIDATDPKNISGVATVPWIAFFNSIFNGDAGADWTPTFTNLTVVGTSPVLTGRVYQISKYLSIFKAKVVPGTNTSATAGVTYIDNFPLTATGDGICFAVSGLLGTNSGMVEAATNRIYVPAWTTVTVPLTIIGLVEAS